MFFFKSSVLCALLNLVAQTMSRPSPFFGTVPGHSLEAVVDARHRAAAMQNVVSVAPFAESGASYIEVVADSKVGPTHPSGLIPATIRWSFAPEDAAEEACADDAILVYCSESSERFEDFGDLVQVSSQRKSRKGPSSVPVRLLAHAGCALVFRYVDHGALLLSSGTATTTACPLRVSLSSAPVSLGADTDAVGTRIAYGDGIGDMIFTWTSMDASAPASVRVGTQPGGPYDLVFSASAPPVTYEASDMCHAPANESGITSFLPVGFFHSVVLQSLAPATRYYAVYGQAGGAEAPETTFRTRAAPGADVPTRFVAFGDSATYPVFPGTVTTTDMIIALDAGSEGPVDFVALVGDLAYAEGATLVWALWSAMLWPVASRLPFMVTVGNHETNVAPGGCSPGGTNNITALSQWAGPDPAGNPYGDDSGGEGGYPTYARYRAPSNGLGIFYYSFEHGAVHMTIFSSEHDYRPGSAQYAWLAADFARVNRSTTPWLIVGMHRPMYNSMVDADFTIDAAMAATLESLFVSARVDLVLSGHYHSLLRTTSMQNFTVDPSGASPTYITCGTGGATFHNESIMPSGAPWTAAVDAEWGFGFVETFNRSHLRWTFRANADGGAVHDEAWVVRNERWEA